MEEPRKKKKLVNKLKNKYRLVVLNDETFEEKASFRLSRFNVYAISSLLFTIMVVIILGGIIFTPLKEYIPGYGDVNMRKELIFLKLRLDSLSLIANKQEFWIRNITNVLKGKVDSIKLGENKEKVRYDMVNLDELPAEDAVLREEIEREENYSLLFSNGSNSSKEKLTKLNLFPPIKGYITSGFDPNENHFGIDIVAPEKRPVKAILDGKVMLASWTLKTGYVIGIQHKYNLVSFYKHNSVLLKKVGNFVNVGDVIAIIGSSGELTTGPHLHFELWHNEASVNPEDYIVF